MNRLFLGILSSLFFISSLQGQSIYSFEGLGELEHQGMPQNFGMGEVGIGMPSLWYVNTMNPAHLVYNQFSSFQVGLEIDRRNFTGENTTGNDIEGGLRFIGYAFPIKPGKWSSSFGILPYSQVSYNAFGLGEVEGTDGEVEQLIDDRGEGGLTSLFWSNGVAITENLYAGIRANFTFGSIEKETSVFVAGDDVVVSNSSLIIEESYSDLNIELGLAYQHKLNESKLVHLGLTYAPKSSINGTEERFLNRLSSSSNEIETIDLGSSDIPFEFPSSYGFGVSYERTRLYKIGIDLQYDQWSQISSNESFNDFTKVAIGGEWIPDFDNVNSYFSRVQYRMGFNYQKLPYIVSGETLNDFGINFGASLPVGGASSLDLGFKYGNLGKVTENLIRETYFKIVVGATINDRWFVKRRYD